MNHFTMDARQIERKFLRFLQKRKSFLTVMGRENQLVSVNRDYLVIQSAENQKPWSLSQKS